MAMLRFARATIVHPTFTTKGWGKVRTAASGKASLSGGLIDQASEIFGKPFNPSDYLLTHATIVASVDTEKPAKVKLGSVVEDGFRVNRKYANFRVTADTEKYINNNCFIPGTPITMADGTTKPIEEIRVGDMVLTHKGRARKVLETFQHEVDTDLLEIKVHASNERLFVTQEHPFFVFSPPQSCVECGQTLGRKTQAISHLLGKHYCSKECYYKRKIPNAEFLAQKGGAFVEARNLTTQDFAAVPVVQDVVSVGLTLGQARLLGLFLAEGYYELDSRRDNLKVGVCWAFHEDERHTLAQDVLDLMQSEFGVSCVVRDHADDRGIHVTTKVCPEAVNFFSQYVKGAGAATKVLAAPLMTAPLDVQKEILRGWFDGDGSAFDAGPDFRMVGVTASRSLANQIRLLLHRQGIAPQVQHSVSEGRRRLHLQGGNVSVVTDPNKVCHAWQVSVGGCYLEDLAQTTRHERSYAEAMGNRGSYQQAPALRFLNGYCLQMITAVGRAAYEGPVHNFETEEDHSYIAGGVAVHNCDAWDRQTLLKSYRTFIGAHNFVEHVQIEDLSKGRIIDAVARDIGDSVYVDILIATDRKHTDLVDAIQSGKMSTMSMGCTIDFSCCTKCGNVAVDETEMCFPPETRVLMADGTYRMIQDVAEGDMVVTHTGQAHPVVATMSRHHKGHVVSLDVDGVPVAVKATANHPFWVLRPTQVCACGCGESLKRTVEHRRGAVQAFQRRFLPGHNSKIWLHNRDNILSFDDYRKEFEANLEFAPAGDLNAGDYLAFPIPQNVTQTADATNENARLLGYFLAEGSFVKRDGKRVGVSFDFGAHEQNTLAKDAKALLDAKWGAPDRHAGGDLDWAERVREKGIKPFVRRKNSRSVPDSISCPTCSAPSPYVRRAFFKPGREDCYSCKVCERGWWENADRSVQARVYLSNHNSCSVRLMSVEAADWFYQYCGEYAEGKKLHGDVVQWPPEVQKQVLVGWLAGDGDQWVGGIKGSTTSFHLLSQMHVLAARCGWYARKSVLFGARSAEVSNVVNGDGSVTMRDHRGWLPLFTLNLSNPVGFDGEVRFTGPETARVTMSKLTTSFKRVGNWLLYRVRSVAEECYDGVVHNMEVAKDNSYVVEGLAVHNCSHVRYMKGNTFFDENGVKRKIAELCGHPSINPTGGVTFIEASWVETPAFEGAVMRNVLEAKAVPAKVLRQAQQVLSSVPAKWDDKARQKRAFLVATDDFGEGEEGEEAKPAAPAEPTDKFKPIEDEVTQAILDRVTKSLKQQVQKDKNQDSAPNDTQSTGAPDSTLTKQAAFRQYAHGLSALVKTARSDIDLIDRVASYNQSMGVQIPIEIYRAAVHVGSAARYSSVQHFITACRGCLGRNPSKAEVNTMLRLGKLLEVHHSHHG